ncbi:MAG: hypothetical protein ACXQS2_03675 [Methermicoccaceae archaeon]
MYCLLLVTGITAQQYLVALYLTILMEFLMYLFLTRFHVIQPKIARLFFASVVINTLTNPAVNYIYSNIYDNVIVLETLVCVVESFMVFLLFNLLSIKIKYSKAMMVSVFANLFSWLVGSPLAMIIHQIKQMFGV